MNNIAAVNIEPCDDAEHRTGELYRLLWFDYAIELGAADTGCRRLRPRRADQQRQAQRPVQPLRQLALGLRDRTNPVMGVACAVMSDAVNRTCDFNHLSANFVFAAIR